MKKLVESNFNKDRKSIGSSNNKEKWTLNLTYYNYAKGFFITLSFVSMISTGFFGIPLISSFFLDKDIDLWNITFTITSLLGCIWGYMAYSQFDIVIKTVKDTWLLSKKLDPMIGEYNFQTLNPETKKFDNGYVYNGLVSFWDSENEVPLWLDKGKYWKIYLELQNINKNIKLKVINDRDLEFNNIKKNLIVTVKENQYHNIDKKYIPKKSPETTKFSILIPQWLVINTEYKRYNINSQIQITSLASTISDINKNIPKIIDEIVFREKTILTHSWIIFFSIATYLNKSLPLRIIYNEIKGILPGAKKKKIQYINNNLSWIPTETLIDAIINKGKSNGIGEESLNKIRSLTEFLKNEYEKLGLGEGSSEYHNLHHSLEVTYMSLNMLPNELHGYSFDKRDREIMLVAGLLHDYDPIQRNKEDNTKYSRVPVVNNTIKEIRKRRIHDAYFTFNEEELINYFKSSEQPLSLVKDFTTTHPELLEEKENKIESKIIEALIWRTDYPFDDIAQNNLKQLLLEIAKEGYPTEKINLLAEILSLSDLSVTYLSSDPLLAWNRVVKLYEELDFPLVEAVARTDRFLMLFSEGSLFKEIISQKNFPEVFRQKWNNVYQFFHEGNPTNTINKIILSSITKYQKINMEIEITNCEFIIMEAINNKEEFFIGIGKDKDEIIKAQSILSKMKLENIEILHGDMNKLLPFIRDKSIDSFILTIIKNKNQTKSYYDKTEILKNIFGLFDSKSITNGTIKIITDKEETFKSIMILIPKHKFRIIEIVNKNITNIDPMLEVNHFEKLYNIKILILQRQYNIKN